MALVIATWGYSGYFPYASGTAGSLAAILTLILIRLVYPLEFISLFVFAVLTTAVSVWATDRVAKEIGMKDPSICVSDEAAGMYFTLVFVPINPFTLIAGFFLFRFFDILKPYPIRKLESLPGGWGITMDDVLAGLYGAVILYFLYNSVWIKYGLQNMILGD